MDSTLAVQQVCCHGLNCADHVTKNCAVVELDRKEDSQRITSLQLLPCCCVDVFTPRCDDVVSTDFGLISCECDIHLFSVYTAEHQIRLLQYWQDPGASRRSGWGCVEIWASQVCFKNVLKNTFFVAVLQVLKVAFQSQSKQLFR